MHTLLHSSLKQLLKLQDRFQLILKGKQGLTSCDLDCELLLKWQKMYSQKAATSRTTTNCLAEALRLGSANRVTAGSTLSVHRARSVKAPKTVKTVTTTDSTVQPIEVKFRGTEREKREAPVKSGSKERDGLFVQLAILDKVKLEHLNCWFYGVEKRFLLDPPSPQGLMDSARKFLEWFLGISGVESLGSRRFRRKAIEQNEKRGHSPYLGLLKYLRGLEPRDRTRLRPDIHFYIFELFLILPCVQIIQVVHARTQDTLWKPFQAQVTASAYLGIARESCQLDLLCCTLDFMFSTIVFGVSKPKGASWI